MSWEITYRDKWSGRTVVHVNKNSRGDAERWARTLAQENNCKATCEFVHKGPHTDNSGRREHLVSYGDEKE